MVDHRALAETALQKARWLRPDAGVVLLAAARHFFKANRDLDQAHIEVGLARRTLPNSAELEKLAGRINRIQGRWEDAIRCLQKAIAINPRDLSSRGTLCTTSHLMWRWDGFARASTELMAILPPQDAAPQGRALLKSLGQAPVPGCPLCMDRAYEGNETHRLAVERGYVPVVPTHPNRVEPCEYDRVTYRRHEVERLFRRLRGYRRICTRYNKLDGLFLAFVHLALIFDALR